MNRLKKKSKYIYIGADNGVVQGRFEVFPNYIN